MMNTDLSITLFLQSRDWAITIMKFASSLGSAEFMLLSMPFLYWCWDAKQGFRVGLMLVTSHGLNAVLKIALHSPRPYWVDPNVQAWSTEPSFGMPSGHAQNAVSIWGLTAHLIHKRWAYLLAAVTCLFIGLSRAYLGVHFLGDVLVGWGVGAVLLGSSIKAMPVMEEKIVRMNLKGQILLATLASLAIIALYLLGLAGTGAWQMPSAWEANALAATGEPIDPFSPVNAFCAAGMMLGISSGYAVLKRRGGFLAGGPLSRRLVRYLLGMIGVVLIWYGLKEAVQIEAAGWILDYIRSMLAGLWVTLGAPLMFIGLGLAKREQVDGQSAGRDP
jgi:membrane-associated phospholipid phosphatase